MAKLVRGGRPKQFVANLGTTVTTLFACQANKKVLNIVMHNTSTTHVLTHCDGASTMTCKSESNKIIFWQGRLCYDST